MARGLSELQKAILIAVHRLESPVCRPDDLRARVREVARYIYGDTAKSGTHRAAFARATVRLQERGLVELAYPGLRLTRDSIPKARWLILTDTARNTYRLTPRHDASTLTDSTEAA